MRARGLAGPAVLVALALSCSGGGGGGSGGGPVATLTVAPATATVSAGGMPVLLTATLTGSAEGVAWTLSPQGVGNLSASSGLTTLYAPPATLAAAAEVTVTARAGALSASARITVQPARQEWLAELLAWTEVPRDLVVVGSEVVWSEASDEPVRAVPAAGGEPRTVARRLEDVTGLALEGVELVLLDRRRGFGPSGCSGPGAIAALVRAAPDGSGWAQLALEDACYDAAGPVLAGGSAYWVTSTASPPSWVLRRTPLDGTPGSELSVSGTGIGGLTRDGDALYWYEGRFPEGGAIVRAPLAGGPRAVVWSGTSQAPLSGVFTVRDRQVIFVELGYLYPGTAWLRSVPVAGGSPAPLADLSGRPHPAALVTTASEVLWAEGDAVRAVPLAGGAERTVLSGLGTVLELRPSGADLLALVATGLDRAATARLVRVPLTGGEAITIAGGLELARALAVDGGLAYWAESSIHASIEGMRRVARAPLAGGAVETVLDGVAPSPGLAAGGGKLWLADRWRVKGVGLDGAGWEQLAHLDDGVGALAYQDGSVFTLVGGLGQVLRLPTAGGAPALLHPGSGYAELLRAAGAHVYWVDSLDTIRRVPKAGGAAETVAAGLAAVTDLVVDGEHVYAYENDAARIVRIPAAGGAPVEIAPAHRGVSTRLAVSGGFLYVLDPWALVRVPVAGGALEPLLGLEAIAEPTALVVDASGAYFTLTDGEIGAIVKATPP